MMDKMMDKIGRELNLTVLSIIKMPRIPKPLTSHELRKIKNKTVAVGGVAGLYFRNTPQAGSWGVLFPTSGNVLSRENIMMTTSLMSARALYALHRRGLEWRSIGDDVMCGGEMSPYLPKNQYRFQVFHPVSETDNNHVLGEMLYTWALGRTIPAVGEDPLFLIWRWIDCCNTSS